MRENLPAVDFKQRQIRGRGRRLRAGFHVGAGQRKATGSIASRQGSIEIDYNPLDGRAGTRE
jgi:hypothetical protein